MEEDLDKFITKGTMLIHSPETRNQILSLLQGRNPVESVASALVITVKKLDEVSRREGLEVNDSVKLKGSEELISQIIEVGKAADTLKDFDDDKKELAYSLGVQEYIKGEIQAGRINKQALAEEIKTAMEELPEESRKELDTQLKRINKTSELYGSSGGKTNKPPTNQPPPSPSGLMAGQQEATGASI
ncbi:MAG: hypothetical protein U9N58_08485 [Thermodesulfobacteriota bacterium]|nr:hypothetical protein [Thermodesulfobacteriota bacterium]